MIGDLTSIDGLTKVFTYCLNRKTYYQIQTPEGPGKDFTKHAYQLLSPTKGNVTLIHYIGNEKVAVPFPHGNEKNNCDRPYTRTWDVHLFCKT